VARDCEGFSGETTSPPGGLEKNVCFYFEKRSFTSASDVNRIERTVVWQSESKFYGKTVAGRIPTWQISCKVTARTTLLQRF